MIKVHFIKRDYTCDIDMMVWENDFSKILVLFKSGEMYEHVANVDRDDLEFAWSNLQNGVFTESWGRIPPVGIQPIIGTLTVDNEVYGNRSSMVGDIYEKDDGSLWIVANVGFKNLTEKGRQILVNPAELTPQSVARINGTFCKIIENHRSVLGRILVVIFAYENVLKTTVVNNSKQIEVMNDEDAEKFITRQTQVRKRMDDELIVNSVWTNA